MKSRYSGASRLWFRCQYYGRTNIQTVRKTVKLSKTSKRLFLYKSSQPLQLIGEFSAVTQSASKIHLATYYITRGHGGSLMSPDTAVELGIKSVSYHKVVFMTFLRHERLCTDIMRLLIFIHFNHSRNAINYLS